MSQVIYRNHLINNINMFDVIHRFKQNDEINTLAKQYQITVNKDGSIYDRVTKKSHICLLSWLNDIYK